MLSQPLPIRQYRRQPFLLIELFAAQAGLPLLGREHAVADDVANLLLASIALQGCETPFHFPAHSTAPSPSSCRNIISVLGSFSASGDP